MEEPPGGGNCREEGAGPILSSLSLSCHKPPKLGRLEEVPHSRPHREEGAQSPLIEVVTNSTKDVALTSPCCTTPPHPSPGTRDTEPRQTPPTNQAATRGGTHRLGPARRPWGIAPGMLDRPRDKQTHYSELPPGRPGPLYGAHEAPRPISTLWGSPGPGCGLGSPPRCPQLPSPAPHLHTHPPTPPTQGGVCFDGQGCQGNEPRIGLTRDREGWDGMGA